MRISTFAIVLLTGLIALPPMAGAENPRRVISVTGQGIIVAVPDAAEISAGVASTGATAIAALADNTRRMTVVVEGLKALGVGEHELRTSDFSVSPVYQRQTRDNNEQPAIVGYRVGNIVHIRLRDARDVGRVLDRLVDLGANSVSSVQFTVSDRYERLQTALASAVRNARERAVLMAEAAGATLGPVIEIRESSAPSPRPVFALQARAESADVPVAAGEETLQVTVQATFALE